MWTLKADSNFEKLYKHNSETFLKYFRKHLHWNLFLRTNNEKYPDNNMENILLGIEYIEQLHPPRDIVWHWAEVNYNRHMGYKWAYQKFLGYFEPSKAIGIIKEKINLTSNIEERCLLIDLMLKSCQRSNNLVVLEDALKYICFRHRNEDFEFKNTILLKLHLYFDPKQFNENHWQYVDEIIQVMRIQKEYSYKTHRALQEEHIEFLFRSGKNYKKALIDYIDDNKSLYLHLTLKDLSIKKNIYTAVLNILPELSYKDPDDCKKTQVNYLELIIQFSMKYPEYCISIAHFPSYIDMIQNVLSKATAFDNYDRFLVRLIIQYNFRFPQNQVPLNIDISELIMRIIREAGHLCGFDVLFLEIFCKKERTEVTNTLLEYYFSSLLNNYLDGHIINWFIMNEPRVLVPYFRDVVYKSVNTAFLKHINIIKHYSHLEFDKIVCEIYKEKLDDADNKIRLLEVLQQLLSTCDFLDLVKEKYIPEQDKFTKESKTFLYINYLRCDVAKLLVKVSEPYQSLPIALKFCRGGYLRSGLRGLYSNFYKTAEQKLPVYIDTLSNLPVPCGKHAIFLSCAVMNKSFALNSLKALNESDVSIQKCYFSASLKLFIKHPSQKYLDQILEEISSVNSLDRKLVYPLTKVKVPLKYRIMYLEHCWTFYERLEKAWELNIRKYLEKILQQLHVDLLRPLSYNFIIHVIKNYFTKNESHQPYSFYKFLVLILQYRPEKRMPILDVVFSSPSNVPTQPQIKFFDSLCNYVRTNDSDTQLIQLVLQHWTKFDILDSYDQYVPLKLIGLKMNNPTMDKFAVVVIDLLEQLMSQFGLQIYSMFEFELSCVMDQMIKNDDEKVSFCIEALRYRIDSTTCILIIHLVKSINTENKQRIMKELKNIEIPIVQIYLNQPLTSVFSNS